MRRTAILTAAIALLSMRMANAQTGGTGGTGGTPGTAFAKEDFQIRIMRQDSKGVFIYPNELELTLNLFNRARCECKIPIQISVALTNSGVAKRSTIGKGDLMQLSGQI